MIENRLNTLMEMLESDPLDSFVRYAIAKEYENQGNTDMALKHFLILKSNDPKYVGLYYHLAKLYETQDQISKAIEVCREGTHIAKMLPDFHALSELNTLQRNLEMEL
ncbi:MAG: tetratricopeptide repeat protein [Saprospiraceae bacterium]|nr:tetratricopeptide repeat protein [Saprospiraceae bacterium]MBK8670002.1 tetratricopeptide repeat protein [Saprospiraceae bacterium]